MLKMLINGNETHYIDATDRGFQYGDGIFETIALRNGHVYLWEKHLARMSAACQRLLLPMPDTKLLRSETQSLVKGVDNGIIKIILTRGVGERGLLYPNPTNPTRVLILYDNNQYLRENWMLGVNTRICSTILGQNSVLAGIKHLNRLEHIIARNEWHDSSILEGILLNQDGLVIEGTSTNIFIVTSGKIVTPLLDQCGVDGIMRNVVIEFLQSKNQACIIANISETDIYHADEIFLTNSIVGVWPVKKVNTVDFGVGPVTNMLVRELLPNLGILSENDSI